MVKESRSLVIVESPSKAKTIGKYLGADYTVKACMGHLRDLPKSKMSVDLEHDFTPDYRPVPGKEEIIADYEERLPSQRLFFWQLTRTVRVRPYRGICGSCWRFLNEKPDG